MKTFPSALILLISCIVATSATQKRATDCQSDACKNSAQYLLNAIDQTHDPCNDFYQFACGGLISKTPLPADATTYGTHEELTDQALDLIQAILVTPNSSNTKPVQNAQSLYSICLTQKDDTELLKAEIDKLGGWPIVPPETNNNSLEVLLASVDLTGSDSIFGIGVGVDLINSKQYIIQVEYADIPIPTNLIGAQATLNALINAAEALGAPKSQDTINEIKDTVQFATHLAIISEQELTDNYTEIYKKMTIAELQQQTDPSAETFNWSKYFNALFNKELESSEPVGVFDLEYVTKAIQLIKSTNKNTVINYIVGRFAQDYSSYVGGDLLQQYITLTEELTGISEIEPRNTSCTNVAIDIFAYALAKPYVAEAFPASNIPQVKQIGQSLQSAFEIGVSQTSFYDAETLKTIQQKIAAMQLLVAYPEWINDDQAVETYYSSYPEMNGAHFQNVLNGFTSSVKQNLNLLHRTVDKSSFNLAPSTVYAEYDPSNNAITITAGIIQSPYYTSGQLQALDYGALGSLIGESINAGINNDGAQFDANGNLKPIWDVSTLDHIDDTLECISKQSFCSTSNPTECVNGTSTELDVIFGILGAYDAYQNWVSKNGQEPQLPGLEKYTGNQLLFMNFAQRFCTSTVPANIVAKAGVDQQLEHRFTVNRALANLKEFSQAYQCKVGPMNLGTNSCVAI